MARMAGVGAGLGRSVTGSRWPGLGPLDKRLTTITDGLLQAATAAEQLPAGAGPSFDADAVVVDSRAPLVHVLYVVTHSTAVAVRCHIAQAEWDRRHLPTRTSGHDRFDVGAAQAALDRLDVVEQLAGAYLAAHPPPSSADPEPHPSPGTAALQTALERWDVQVHHTLLGRPDLPDLVRVGRVQALIAATTAVVAGGAAAVGAAQPESARRLALKAAGAEAAWTLLAHRAGQLVGIDGTTDRALPAAAAGLRNAVKTTFCGPASWAPPTSLRSTSTSRAAASSCSRP
jgi:hypothetical protein